MRLRSRIRDWLYNRFKGHDYWVLLFVTVVGTLGVAFLGVVGIILYQWNPLAFYLAILLIFLIIGLTHLMWWLGKRPSKETLILEGLAKENQKTTPKPYNPYSNPNPYPNPYINPYHPVSDSTNSTP